MKLFFSYSHKDEAYRKELESHLAMLRRDGVIETWHDRRIEAGAEIDHTISTHLESADIVLLLVSAYFLDSDYCYDVEMRRAMERHEAGEARVIPVILHPCDWKTAPFGKLRATPTDAKPISTFPNVHEAFYQVALDIRSAANDLQDRNRPRVERPEPSREPGRKASDNLRIRHTFSDRQKDDFLDDCFTFISGYFERSLQELEAQNTDLETRFKAVDASRFTAAVYVNGQKRANCRIGFGTSFGRGIYYSNSDALHDNSFNESLSVTDDGAALLLKPLGMASFGRGRDEPLTRQEAAEYLWGIFIQLLQ